MISQFVVFLHCTRLMLKHSNVEKNAALSVYLISNALTLHLARQRFINILGENQRRDHCLITIISCSDLYMLFLG